MEQKNKKIPRKGLINNISVGSIVGAIIFLELLVVIGGWKYKKDFVSFSWPDSVSDCIRLTIRNMLLYPAMIPAIPNMSKNQGAVSSHLSSQVPIKKPTTTDNPTSNPIEL